MKNTIVKLISMITLVLASSQLFASVDEDISVELLGTVQAVTVDTAPEIQSESHGIFCWIFSCGSSNQPVATVSEPGMFALVGLGLAGLVVSRRTNKK